MLYCFLEKTTWGSLADVTLLAGVHKCLYNFWFKRMEDCYIRVSQIVKTKSGVLLIFVYKERHLLPFECIPDVKCICLTMLMTHQGLLAEKTCCSSFEKKPIFGFLGVLGGS